MMPRPGGGRLLSGYHVSEGSLSHASLRHDPPSIIRPTLIGGTCVDFRQRQLRRVGKCSNQPPMEGCITRQKTACTRVRELPSQVANALPEVARRESGRIRQPTPKPPEEAAGLPLAHRA